MISTTNRAAMLAGAVLAATIGGVYRVYYVLQPKTVSVVARPLVTLPTNPYPSEVPMAARTKVMTRAGKVEPLEGEDRDDALASIAALLTPNRLSEDEVQDARNRLAELGHRVIDTIADELFKGNSEPPDINRVLYIDALGRAAKDDPKAASLLEAFVRSDLDPTKPRRLVHKDLIDRLEAFEFFVGLQPQAAADLVNRAPEALHDEYLAHLVIGLKMTGLKEQAAKVRAHELLTKGTL